MKLFSKKNKVNKGIQSFSEENVLSFSDLALVRGGDETEDGGTGAVIE